MKPQVTCPLKLTSGSFLIGGSGILVIPSNHLFKGLLDSHQVHSIRENPDTRLLRHSQTKDVT